MNFFNFERRITPKKVAETDIDVSINTTNFRDGALEETVKDFDWKTFQEIMNTLGAKSKVFQVFDPGKKITLQSAEKFKLSKKASAAVRKNKKADRIMLTLNTQSKHLNSSKPEERKLKELQQTVSLIHELLHVANDKNLERDPYHETVLDEGINEMVTRSVAIEYLRRKGETASAKLLTETWLRNVKNAVSAYNACVYLIYEMVALISIETGIDVEEVRKSLIREHLQGQSQGKILSALEEVGKGLREGEEPLADGMNMEGASILLHYQGEALLEGRREEVHSALRSILGEVELSFVKARKGGERKLAASLEEYEGERSAYKDDMEKLRLEVRSKLAGLFADDASAYTRPL